MTGVQPQPTPAGPELPQPQFGENLHPLLRTLVQNIKPILFGLAGILAVVAIYAVYDAVQNRRVATAQDALGEIVITTNGEAKIKALQDFIAQAPAKVRPAGLFELAATQLQLGQFEQAAATWTSLEPLADAAMQPVVRLGKAQALNQAGKYEEGLALLEALKTQAPEAYKTEVYMYLGEAAELAGKTEQALAAYRELAALDNTGERIKDYLRFKISRLESKADNG